MINGIIQVIISGCRWSAPLENGPETLYNRFLRWAVRGISERVFMSCARRRPAPAPSHTPIYPPVSASRGKGVLGAAGNSTPTHPTPAPPPPSPPRAPPPHHLNLHSLP